MLVESIAVTPVKGLGLNHPASVKLTETGVLGDRRYAMVDARGGVANGKRLGTLVSVHAFAVIISVTAVAMILLVGTADGLAQRALVIVSGTWWLVLAVNVRRSATLLQVSEPGAPA